MSEYIQKSLGEITAYISKGVPPKYVEKPSKNTIIVLNQKCNRDYAISFADSRLHDNSIKRIPEEKIIKSFDVLINSTGTGTAGRIAQIYDVKEKITFDGHMILLRPTSEIDPLYFGYALKMHQSEIEQLAEGSTGQTEINRQRLLSEITISFPRNIHDQQIISSLLFAIDSKIELNNRINHNLPYQLAA